jgi:hypothetical protein
MKPKLLLRAAAGLMLFHAAGHTMGMLQWAKAHTPEQQTVISAMTDHKFPFMGAVHSFGDSFNGFGTAATITMLLLVWLLLLTASFSASQPQMAGKLLIPLSLSLIALCVMEFIYFFLLASVTTLLAALCTVAAMLLLPKKNMVA